MVDARDPSERQGRPDKASLDASCVVAQRLGYHTFYSGVVTTTEGTRPDGKSEDMLALERQVCFALSVAARNVVAVYRPVLEPLGLTHPQYLVMLALWQHGSLSVKELSRLLQLDPGTLSPLLKRLEAAGLLRRERDPKDQRNLALALTDSGKALRAEAETIPAGIVERLGMPIEELMALHGALTQVIAASQRALTTPAVADGTEPQATVA
jgi:MarR family transcriptional regulator, organic hydroperoxide resistance regulator